jgi:hypothetical protein
MRRPTPPPTTACAWRTKRPAGIVLAALVLAVPVGAAEEPPANPKSVGQPVYTTEEQAGIGATTLFLNGFAGGSEVYTELMYLSAGEALRYWTFYDPNYVHNIAPADLDGIEDRTPLPKDPGDKELQPYFNMLIYANRTAPEALDRAALRQDDLWPQLFANPSKYRGEVVHFEGKLKKLRQFKAQSMAVQGGALQYYEGYMEVGATRDDPLFIQITELPPGLKPGDNLDMPVAFSGYFYKIFRYTAVDTKKTHKDRLAPLAIGHTVRLLGPAKAPVEDTTNAPDWSIWLGPLFFGVIGLTVALLFSLGYWFRSGDRRVRGRLSAARYGDFVAPPPDAPGEPGASATGDKTSTTGDEPSSSG